MRTQPTPPSVRHFVALVFVSALMVPRAPTWAAPAGPASAVGEDASPVDGVPLALATAEAEEAPESTDERVTPAAKPTGLRPFGSRLFSPDAKALQPLPETVTPVDYTLGPGDVVQLSYWSEFLPQETHDVAVDAQGQVNLPVGGVLAVRGVTLDRFRELAQEQLSRLYKNVKVHVALTKLRSIRVWIGGEATRVGTHLLSPHATAFNALYAAGGPNDRGSMRRISLHRGQEEIAVIDLYKYLLTGDAEDDVRLESGDRLFIPVVGPQVSVEGEVRRQALYELAGGERLFDLLEWAGGLKPTGYAKRVQIARIEGNARRVLRDLDASALLQSPTDESNLPVQPGDEIRVLPVVGHQGNIVWLGGQVNRTGAFEWHEGMRLKDLLEQAEGLRDDADLARGEVTRTEPGAGPRLLSFDVARALAGEASQNLELKPRDRVVVYATRLGGPPVNVQISGPVEAPGHYRHVAGMTARDLLEWAGEVAEDAQVVYCTLERPTCPGHAPKHSESRDTEAEPVGGWVQVEGRVGSPGRVPYRLNAGVDHYLREAGGLLSDADREGIRIFRPNGTVVEATIGFPTSGDLVIVPPVANGERDPVSKATPKYILDHAPRKHHTLTVVLDLEKVRAGDPAWNVMLCPGDHVQLYTPDSLRWRGGYVSAEGEVSRARTYQRAEGMTVADLLFKAGGLLPDADPHTALLHRPLPGGERQTFTLDPTLAQELDEAQNLLLKDGDTLVVLHHEQVALDRKEVSIQGAVQEPGSYPRSRDMQLKDLLLAAGGLLPEAHNVAEIVRLGEDGERHLLRADLDRLLNENDDSQDVVLQDYDSVTVPSVREGRRLAATVTVSGEVTNPGVYPLDDPENTTLTALLARAGGLTPEAFLPGATIRRRVDTLIMDHQQSAMAAVMRESQRVEAKEFRALMAENLTTALPGETAVGGGSLATGETVAQVGPPVYTYVPADFEEAVSRPQSEADVALRDGDTLTIPKRPVMVMVMGAVVRPVTVLYVGRRPLSFYIEQAGGYSRDARLDQIEVIRPNGAVLPARKAGPIVAGDIIYVPSKVMIYKEKKSWLDMLQSMGSLLSIAVLATR